MHINFLFFVLIISISATIENENNKCRNRRNNIGCSHHVEKRRIMKLVPTIWTPLKLTTKSNLITMKQNFVTTAMTRDSTKHAMVSTTTPKAKSFTPANVTVAPIRYNPVQLRQYCQCFNMCLSRLENFNPANELTMLITINPPSTKILIPRIDMCENDTCAGYPEVSYTLGNSKKFNKSLGITIKTCGFKQYFLGKETILASENQKFCCSLGLRSVLILRDKEFKCILYNLLLEKNKGLFDVEYYATGFRDLNQNREFKSCPSKDRLPEGLWLDKQPDNSGGKEYCTAVKFSANSSAMGYMDIPCDAKVKPMCQHILNKTIPSYNSLQFAFTRKFKCPSLIHCPIYNQENLIKESNMNTSNTIFIDSCGPKYYYLIKYPEISQMQLYKTCCTFGMYGAFIETQKEFDCIQKIYLRNIEKSKDSVRHGFWISYHDAENDRSFFSCPNKTKTKDDLWALSQPDNKGEFEGGGLAIFNGDPVNIGLHDASGINLFGAMCQHIPEVGKPSTTSTMKISNEINNFTPSVGPSSIMK